MLAFKKIMQCMYLKFTKTDKNDRCFSCTFKMSMSTSVLKKAFFYPCRIEFGQKEGQSNKHQVLSEFHYQNLDQIAQINHLSKQEGHLGYSYLPIHLLDLYKTIKTMKIITKAGYMHLKDVLFTLIAFTFFDFSNLFISRFLYISRNRFYSNKNNEFPIHPKKQLKVSCSFTELNPSIFNNFNQLISGCIVTPQFEIVRKFDKYIINLNQCLEKMVKKISSAAVGVPHPALEEEKESIFEQEEERSTIPALDYCCLPEPAKDKLIPLKKPIAKERKIRAFNPEGRFQREHRQRFFLFPFHYASQFPFCKISWEYWKPSGYFTRMAQFLSTIGKGMPTKTGDQCKSFDERQKKQIYTNVDLLEASSIELQEGQLDTFSIEVLTEYFSKMDQKSEYMNFLTAQNELERDVLQAGQGGSASDLQKMKREEEEERACAGMEDLIFNEFFDQRQQGMPTKVF